MKEKSDGQKDYAYALGELSRRIGENLINNPFKKNNELYYFWKLGYQDEAEKDGA